MKKVIVIFILSLLTFYWVGYELLFLALEIQSSKSVAKKINEKRYDDSKLISVSVDLELPYTTDWKEYEHVEGQVIIDNIPYTYVERIYKGGKMTYRCLTNTASMKLKKAKLTIAGMNMEKDMDGGKESSKLPSSFAKKLLSDVEPDSEAAKKYSINYQDQSYRFNSSEEISSPFLSVPTPPPDRAII